MNTTEKMFLTVLKAAMLGEMAEPDRELTPEEWCSLFRIARIHQVLPLIYDAVYPYLTKEAAALAADIKMQVRVQVMRQTLKTSGFLALYPQLCAAGGKPLVVKGLICRNLYPKPDLRPSGDEDVLILPEQFADCHRVLLKNGMYTSLEYGNLPHAYEVPYRKEGSPLYIELHRNLFPPESTAYGNLNRFFGEVHDRVVSEEIQGVRVYTMEPTDHLMYLVCHAFKHFLHSGFGIRQVCDIVLFANRYGNRVDWLRLQRNCRKIHADQFAAAMFEIGRKYLVFDPDRAAYPNEWRNIPVDEQPMLKDLLAGGLYGDSSMSRQHSSNMTLAAVTAQKQGKKTVGTTLAAAFPAAEKLEGRYPYLKKHPYLVPAAWSHRIWQYVRETKEMNQNSAAEALKIGNTRIELLKYYGIIK